MISSDFTFTIKQHYLYFQRTLVNGEDKGDLTYLLKKSCKLFSKMEYILVTEGLTGKVTKAVKSTITHDNLERFIAEFQT